MSQNNPQLPYPSQTSLAQIQQDLPNLLLHALERRWYDSLDMTQVQLEPVQASNRDDSRFLTIAGLSRQTVEENLAVLNMQNVLSSFRDGSHSLAYVLQGMEKGVGLHLGVRRLNNASTISTDDYSHTLASALRGNFPHIDLAMENASARHQALDQLASATYLASITGIPSEKHLNTSHFTQTVDRLVNALRGQDYTILVLAEPMPEASIAKAMDSCRQLSEEIHSIARRARTESVGQNINLSRGRGQTQGISGGTGSLLGMVLNLSVNQSRNTTRGMQIGQSRSMSESIETLDKTAEFCEMLLDDYLERLQAGRNLGFWNVGVFLGTNNKGTFFQSQGIMRGLYSGEYTRFEPLRMVDLTRSSPIARQGISLLCNPALSRQTMYSPLGYEFQSLGTPLTTTELSILMNLPQTEVPGIRIKNTANFNINPLARAGFEIGKLIHQDQILSTAVKIVPSSLQRHTFVTGLTGSGKTNTCLGLLLEAYRNQKLGFLVIDPAKTEYRLLLEDEELRDELLIFTLGDETTSPFRLNPFEFVPGFPLLTHIDLLKSVFNAAFPMQGPLGYLLEEAIVNLYEERGWDIATSTNKFIPRNESETDHFAFLPRLQDLYQKIDRLVAEKQYSGQITQDITAALKVRLGSLLNGGKGFMLNTQRSIPMSELLRRPVVLELRRMGDDDEKALVMGLLFIQLYEACQNRSLQSSLQHITLIEEAHRLLRNVSTIANADYANPRGKAVEMFSDMMAELRSYGEGFIIVDQMPNKLVPDVIKGSNLKIVHRLLSLDDRTVIGNTIGLRPEQVDYISRLTVGQAIVHSEELEEACLTAIYSVENELTASFRQRIGSTQSLAHSVGRNAEKFCATLDMFDMNYTSAVLQETERLIRSQLLQRNSPLIHIGMEFVTTLLTKVPDISECAKIDKQISTILSRMLDNAEINVPQEISLHVAKKFLTRQIVLQFCADYSETRDWLARIQMETLLLKIWSSHQTSSDNVIRLHDLVTQRIAVAPRRITKGCLHCQAMCRFGHHFQQPGNKAVQVFAAQVKSADKNVRPSLSKIQEFALESYPYPINNDLKLAAAYCLVAQATEDPTTLQRFREAAFKSESLRK